MDGAGKRRFVGNAANLKVSQWLARMLVIIVAELRAYPSKLGESIHELYVEELSRAPRGDLRVDCTPKGGLSEKDLFSKMELGDTWEDASLRPALDYLFKSRHTRTADTATTFS